MSLFVSTSRRRRALTGIAGAVAAAAFFASGVLVANAMHDDSPAQESAAHTTVPGKRANDGDIAIGVAPSSEVARSGAGSSGASFAPDDAMPIAPGGCSAPLPGMLDGTSIDLTAGGLAPKFAGNGFVLESVTLRGDVPCGEPGATPVPLVETRYRHTETGFELDLSQRAVPEPGANIIRQNWGQAYADGYLFTASVSGGPMIMAGDAIGEPAGDAITEPAGDAAKSVSSTARPAIWPGPANDPRMAALVEQVLNEVAPSVEAKCYYRQVSATWGDLAGVGIGDPRPALPAGFDTASGNLYFTRFTNPAPECGPPALDTGEPAVTFSVSLSDGQGFLGISANSRNSADPVGPGNADAGYINWNSDKFWFSISGQTGKGESFGAGALEAIARALDPGFGSTCIVTSRTLEESALPGLGFRVPAAPEGYRTESSQFAAIEGNPACGASPGAGYALSWLFYSEAKSSVIEAGITKNLDENDPRGYGYISEDALVWKDDSGAAYHVSALKLAAPRETLLAVAKSMDPAFDESKLLPPDSAPGGPKTLPAQPPQPVRD